MTNQTPESVIAEAMVNAGAPLMHSRVEESVAAALRRFGLLSEGTPSEAQVEAAAKALHETRNPWFAAYGAWGAAGFKIKQAFSESARAALVAAQGATTEELAKIKPLFENLSREYPNEYNKRVKAEAELETLRDAVARVRAIHYSAQAGVEICGVCLVPFPCATVAALDGAPEPAWEYGVQYIPPSVIAGEPVKCGSERAARLAVRGTSEPIRLLRRRPKVVHPAGPWLPVEGESK